MILNEMKLKGSYIIEIDKLKDVRGFFSRTWDKELFHKIGLRYDILQSNISYNKRKGTIRGIHYQEKPYEEAKLVSCIRGSVYEVFIDLRKNSKTFRQWYSVRLTDKNFKMLYVPKGFALGFQTLENNTILAYQMFQKYMPKYAKGVRWNDPTFNIKWPLKVTVLSKKDQLWKEFG